MLTPSRAFTISLSGVAGLVLLAFVSHARVAPRAKVAPQAGRPARGGPVLGAAAVAQGAQFSFDPDTLVGWGRGPVQPIFFSHRHHAGEYEVECLYCHSNTDISSWASMPPVELCLGCHRVVKPASSEIAKLRGYVERGEPIPWERVYRVADFVQFNHGRHVRAEVECQECHGEVEEHDVLWQWSPLTMGWCLECHREPGEDEAKLAEAAANEARYAKEGRESYGLHPRSIDSQYGVLKGPIDCVACHY